MASLVSSRREISAEWLEIIQNIPGYDPVATAGDAWFDEDEAALRCQFFPECLTHAEGDLAGQPFILEPWEQAIVANLWGWKRRDELGRIVRRYKEMLLYIARKNGKTPFSAGLCDCELFCLATEIRAQIVSAAADTEQAGKLFEHAAGMVENEPELSSRARIYRGYGQRAIVNLETQSAYKVISSEASTKHGGNLTMGLVDEVHALKGRDLVDVIRTSTASLNRANTLLVWITTADYERESICNEIYERACKVRDGWINDPAFLPVIFEVTKQDDWEDEETWKKANPNLGVSVSLEYLRREYQRAKEVPAYENTFKRLHLNLRTEQDVRWLSAEKWKGCGGALDIDLFKGDVCWGALDLGSTSDLTSFCISFRREVDPLPEEDTDEQRPTRTDTEESESEETEGARLMALKRLEVVEFWWHWAPREAALEIEKKQNEGISYLAWEREGWITITEGNEVDYEVVERDILAICEMFQVQEVTVDRLFQGAHMCQNLIKHGVNVTKHGQGFLDMAAPTKDFELLVRRGRLKHGDNPILKWMAGNVAVEEDSAGNLKPSKKKSAKKIDGIVTGVMACGKAIAGNAISSRYDGGMYAD